MSGQYTADRVTAMLAEHGETMTLRRPGTPDVDVTIKAKRFGSAAERIVNSQTRTTFGVMLSNSEIAASAWPGPPRAKDHLVIGSRTYIVEEVDTRLDSGVTVAHRVKVTG